MSTDLSYGRTSSRDETMESFNKTENNHPDDSFNLNEKISALVNLLKANNRLLEEIENESRALELELYEDHPSPVSPHVVDFVKNFDIDDIRDLILEMSEENLQLETQLNSLNRSSTTTHQPLEDDCQRVNPGNTKPNGDENGIINDLESKQTTHSVALLEKVLKLEQENKHLSKLLLDLEEELSRYSTEADQDELLIQELESKLSRLETQNQELEDYRTQLSLLDEKIKKVESEKKEMLNHQESLEKEIHLNRQHLDKDKGTNEPVKADIQELKDKIENLSQELVHEKESNSKYEQTLSNYEDEILKLKSNIENITNEKNELEKLRNEISKEIVDKNEVSKDIIDENKVSNNNNEDIIRKYEGQIEILESKIEKYECSKLESLQHQQELENEILTLKNLKKDETDIKTYEERISNLLQQLEQNEDDKTELLSRLQTLEDSLSYQNSSKIRHEESLREYEEQILTLESKLETVEKEKEELFNQQRNNTEELDNNAQMNHETIAQYENQIIELENQLTEYLNEKNDLSSQVLSLEQQLSSKRNEYLELESTITDYESTITDYESQIETLNKRLETFEIEQNQVHSFEIDNKELKNQVENLLVKLESKEKEHATQYFDIKDRMETLITTHSTEKLKLQGEIQQLQEELQSIQSINSTLKSDKEELEKQHCATQNTLKSMQSSFESLDNKYQGLLKSSESSQQDYKIKCEELEQEVIKLSESKELLQQELTELHQYVEEMDLNMEQTFDKEEKSLFEESLNTINEKQKTITNLNMEVDLLKQEIQEISHKYETQKTDMETMQEELTKKDIEIKQYSLKIKDMDLKSASMDNEQDILVLYESTKEDHNKLLNEMKEAEEKQNLQIESYIKRIEMLQNQNSQLKIAFEELEQQNVDFKWIEEQYQRQQKIIEELTKQNHDMVASVVSKDAQTSSEDQLALANKQLQARLNEYEIHLQRMIKERELLLERLDVESQAKEQEKLHKALHIMSIENDDMRKQLQQAQKVINNLMEERNESAHNINLVAAKNELIKTLKIEKEQLIEKLSAKSMELENLLNNK